MILCGNKKAEDDMISIFKDFEVNREQVIAQNFMRTVLSAISCTPASRGNDLDTLEAKQVHITSLLERGSLGLNALRLDSSGEPKL